MSKRNRILAVILVAVLMVTGFIMPEKATGAGLALTATDLWMSAWAAYCASHGMANTFTKNGVAASASDPVSVADVDELVEDLVTRYATDNNLPLTLENWADLLESSVSVTANTGSGTVLHVAAAEVSLFDSFADWLLGTELDMSRTESGFVHSGGSFGDISTYDEPSLWNGQAPYVAVQGAVITSNGSIRSLTATSDVYLYVDGNGYWYGASYEPFFVQINFGRGDYFCNITGEYDSNGDYYFPYNGRAYGRGFGTGSVPVLQDQTNVLGKYNNVISDSKYYKIELGATDENSGVIGIPDTKDQDYAPDAISVPLNQPWDDAYAGANGLVDALTGIMEKIRGNTIALAGEGTDDPGGGGSSSDPDDYQALGLADVFPFCLPFDLYNFFACLGADPVAPSFEVPINFPPLNYSYTFEIDLSAFNSVAAILRKMELLGFCVALILISRQKLLRG